MECNIRGRAGVVDTGGNGKCMLDEPYSLSREFVGRTVFTYVNDVNLHILDVGVCVYSA